MKRFILILALTGIINSANSMDCWQAMSFAIYNAHNIYVDSLYDCARNNLVNLAGQDVIGSIMDMDCAIQATGNYNTTVDDVCELFYACIGLGG